MLKTIKEFKFQYQEDKNNWDYGYFTALKHVLRSIKKMMNEGIITKDAHDLIKARIEGK